jgi:parvulin-like peptidyl-prolyl isomerase
MLPQEVAPAPLSDVERAFGADFAARLGPLAPGQWTGPVESGFGLHLVLVRERTEGRRPDLAEVRAAVEREFLADRRKRQLAATYERLLAKYRVVIERPPGEVAAAARKDGS